MKWRGKSFTAKLATALARQTPPGERSNKEERGGPPRTNFRVDCMSEMATFRLDKWLLAQFNGQQNPAYLLLVPILKADFFLLLYARKKSAFFVLLDAIFWIAKYELLTGSFRLPDAIAFCPHIPQFGISRINHNTTEPTIYHSIRTILPGII